MFKKIIGIILIALAGLFTLGAFSSLYKILTEPIEKTGDEAYDQGQVFGHWIFLVILVLLIFFMFKFGLKLLKKKPISDQTINEIGSRN